MSFYTLFPLLLWLNLYESSLKLYDQCSGIGYKGSNDCPTGSYCRYNSDWWSSCIPGNSKEQTTRKEELTTATTNPIQTTSKSDLLVSLWGRCGGIGHTGSTKCAPGSFCLYQDAWWSQCNPGNSYDHTITTTINRKLSETTTIRQTTILITSMIKPFSTKTFTTSNQDIVTSKSITSKSNLV